MFYLWHKTKRVQTKKKKKGEKQIIIIIIETNSGIWGKEKKKKLCRIFRHFSNCLNVINSRGRSCLMTNLYLRNLGPLMTALFSPSLRPPTSLLFTLLKNNCAHYIRLFQAFSKNKRFWCLKQWIASTMIISQQWHSKELLSLIVHPAIILRVLGDSMRHVEKKNLELETRQQNKKQRSGYH